MIKITAQKMIARAIAKDKQEAPVLKNWQKSHHPNGYRLVSTDTHRLHIAEFGETNGEPERVELLNDSGVPASGVFPNWERVIPKVVTRAVLVDAAYLAIALESVAILAAEVNNRVELVFGPDIVVSCEVGARSVLAEIPAICENCEGFRIAFNAKYLLDTLPPSKEAKGTVRIEMTESDRPAVITWHDVPAEYRFRAVIMPMALNP